VWEALVEFAEQEKTRPSYNNCHHKTLAEMRGERLANIGVCIGS
jgi:hypothetical protein